MKCKEKSYAANMEYTVAIELLCAVQKNRVPWFRKSLEKEHG
jgi:hypothetical protein